MNNLLAWLSTFWLLDSFAKEDLLLSQPQTEEIHVIYTGGCPPRAGRTRRTPFTAKKVETAVVRFPVSRLRIKTAKKERFTSCGEATNYQGTYSGVKFRPASELPLISSQEKGKVLATAVPAVPAVKAAPDTWRDLHGEDVPLFWQEGKPICFYIALLDELKIKAVFDVTPGTGALMEACLTRGVQYHGLCLNRDHLSLLQAIADRAACGLASVQASSLYSEALAKDIKSHFPDVLLALVPQANEDEDVLEPASGDEA